MTSMLCLIWIRIIRSPTSVGSVLIPTFMIILGVSVVVVGTVVIILYNYMTVLVPIPK